MKKIRQRKNKKDEKILDVCSACKMHRLKTYSLGRKRQKNSSELSSRQGKKELGVSIRG